jgi:hypothetical protein
MRILDPIPYGLGGLDLSNDSAVLSDLANRQQARAQASADADERTRAARDAIKALHFLTERDVLCLLMCIQARIAEGNWRHTDTASAVDDGLLDAVGALESYMENHE